MFNLQILFISYYETFPTTKQKRKINNYLDSLDLTTGQVFHCVCILKNGSGNCTEECFTLNNCPTVIAVFQRT